MMILNNGVIRKETSEMLEAEIIRKLEGHFPHNTLKISVSTAGRIFVDVGKENLRDVVTFLVNEGLMHLSAITALNVGNNTEILYHLGGGGILVTLRITIPSNENKISTITDIIPGALLHEREVHDLFGIKFEGHPDLRPLLLPEDWPKDVHPMHRSGKHEDKS
ncbi:NADH-quinone oxidoreductase subunit C [Candidatus Bathyarchaeota archaeon]|nr:NADH-quinone oxidoreductase subunit C [Candidatus Bathyarchaeota archaeon]